MPNITVELLRGRSIEQRRKFVEAVTAQAVEILNARRQDVRIVFCEIGGHDVANGGVLAADDSSRAEVLARHGGNTAT
jgi:4-oxalocrotonate tautomerase